MKIVSFGSEYRIFPDDLKTFDKFPAATYKINFNPMAGFSLEKIHNFENVEEKTYGNHQERIDKVLNSYDQFNRSLGVILSGDKGMGKSLFTQMLAKEAVEKGMPVIMVTKPFKGIAEFIDKIEQECLVIFDEFEKVFTNRGGRGYGGGDNNPNIESQNDLLGLFDGTSQQKRLYAITVNHLNQVNEFMVSRTGRFHYHIRFDYPTADEIEIYLKDKLDEQYYGEIKHVIAFATRVKLNYDSLRAIAFELNSGYSFKSAISDLNILMTDTQKYDVKVQFTNGQSRDLKSQALNLFAESIRLDGYGGRDEYFSLTFDTSSIITEGNSMVVPGDEVNLSMHDDEGDRQDDVRVVNIEIKQHFDTGVNYKYAAV
jgi:hypothetical protein